MDCRVTVLYRRPDLAKALQLASCHAEIVGMVSGADDAQHIPSEPIDLSTTSFSLPSDAIRELCAAL